MHYLIALSHNSLWAKYGEPRFFIDQEPDREIIVPCPQSRRVCIRAQQCHFSVSLLNPLLKYLSKNCLIFLSSVFIWGGFLHVVFNRVSSFSFRQKPIKMSELNIMKNRWRHSKELSNRRRQILMQI